MEELKQLVLEGIAKAGVTLEELTNKIAVRKLCELPELAPYTSTIEWLSQESDKDPNVIRVLMESVYDIFLYFDKIEGKNFPDIKTIDYFRKAVSGVRDPDNLTQFLCARLNRNVTGIINSYLYLPDVHLRVLVVLRTIAERDKTGKGLILYLNTLAYHVGSHSMMEYIHFNGMLPNKGAGLIGMTQWKEPSLVVDRLEEELLGGSGITELQYITIITDSFGERGGKFLRREGNELLQEVERIHHQYLNETYEDYTICPYCFDRIKSKTYSSSHQKTKKHLAYKDKAVFIPNYFAILAKKKRVVR